MAERTTTIVKSFFFTEALKRNGEISVSDSAKISINRQNYGWEFLELVKQAEGNYPTDTDLTAKTNVIRMDSIRRIVGFDAYAVDKIVDNQLVTSLGYRVWDGVSEWVWVSSTGLWTTPAGSAWNTEAEIANNISTFNPSLKAIGFVVNPRTTDGAVTPEVHEIRIAVEVRLPSFTDDIFVSLREKLLGRDVRPFVETSPVLGSGVKPATEYLFEMMDDANRFLLQDVLANDRKGFRVVDVESVYKIVNGEPADEILSSYVPETNEVILDETVATGTELLVSLIYEPNVVILRRSIDFSSPELIPSLVLHTAITTDSSPHPGVDALMVRNKSKSTALVIHAPYRLTLQCGIMGLVQSTKDEARLFEELIDFLTREPILKSRQTGDVYRIQVLQEFEDATMEGEDLNDLCSFSTTIAIHNVLIYSRRPPQTKKLASGLVFSGSVSADVGNISVSAPTGAAAASAPVPTIS